MSDKNSPFWGFIICVVAATFTMSLIALIFSYNAMARVKSTTMATGRSESKILSPPSLVPAMPATMDNPTADDFLKLASTYGKVDFVSLFCGSLYGNYYYSLTVSYDESEGIDEIEIRRKDSMSELYQEFHKALEKLKRE